MDENPPQSRSRLQTDALTLMDIVRLKRFG
jgi:hypothetical protein